MCSLCCVCSESSVIDFRGRPDYHMAAAVGLLRAYSIDDVLLMQITVQSSFDTLPQAEQ
jgi:hypothetical protein